ncbi:MAG TPA: DUF4342 domain-containing protein [Acidimicrobiia bacterium]|nr:DUF4342 domain-containing protein [Acidimicrobiia bacterium]
MTSGEAGSPDQEKATVEDLKVEGEHLLSKVRELIHEGNVRRIIIKNDEGRTLMEIPLTLGVAGVVILPTLAAVGAIAALVTECTITVERVEGTPGT